MELAWDVVLAVVLVIIAGVLICAETAIARVSRTALEDGPRADTTRSVRLLGMLEDRARYVNALLIASTACTVGATAVVAYVSLGLLPSAPLAILVAVVIMTAVAFAGLGVAARTLGRQHADGVALAFSGVARALAVVLSPIARALILVGNALTPGKGYREGPFASQAELREMVDQAEADSLIEDDERQMIHSVFELGDTIAREVMVPRTEVVFIERTKTLRQALSLGLRSGFSRIPVIGENSDDVVGIIYLKDVVNRVFEHRDAEQSERVESLMRSAYFVPDSKPVDTLLRDMQSARVHMAIVIDEYGGTAGLVTIEDILEEIVGEITDEYDTALPEVERLPSGSYRVLARMHVEDFAELVGIDIDADDEGVETVLGLMARRMGRVPIAGAQLDESGWRLTAERAEGRRNRIGTVLAERIESDDVVDRD
mgnify:CR=1 FL=1